MHELVMAAWMFVPHLFSSLHLHLVSDPAACVPSVPSTPCPTATPAPAPVPPSPGFQNIYNAVSIGMIRPLLGILQIGLPAVVAVVIIYKAIAAEETVRHLIAEGLVLIAVLEGIMILANQMLPPVAT